MARFSKHDVARTLVQHGANVNLQDYVSTLSIRVRKYRYLLGLGSIPATVVYLGGTFSCIAHSIRAAAVVFTNA